MPKEKIIFIMITKIENNSLDNNKHHMLNKMAWLC